MNGHHQKLGDRIVIQGQKGLNQGSIGHVLSTHVLQRYTWLIGLLLHQTGEIDGGGELEVDVGDEGVQEAQASALHLRLRAGQRGARGQRMHGHTAHLVDRVL